MSFIQGRTTSVNLVASTTLAYSSNVTAASLLVGTLATANTGAASMSDNVNGSWTTDVNYSTTNSADDNLIARHYNAGAGSTTATISGIGSTAAAISIHEHGGVVTTAALDKTSSHDISAATSGSSTSITTTGSSGDVVVSVLSKSAQNRTCTISGTGWSSPASLNNSPNSTEDAASGYHYQSAAGADSCTWSISGAAADLSISVASYKLTAGTTDAIAANLTPTSTVAGTVALVEPLLAALTPASQVAAALTLVEPLLADLAAQSTVSATLTDQVPGAGSCKLEPVSVVRAW